MGLMTGLTTGSGWTPWLSWFGIAALVLVGLAATCATIEAIRIQRSEAALKAQAWWDTMGRQARREEERAARW